MPKVYVVQDAGKNLSPAREYGDIEILTRQDGDSTSNRFRLRSKLVSFQPGDYLLLMGNPMLIGFAIHLVLKKHGEVSCLVWDRDHYCYNVERIKE